MRGLALTLQALHCESADHEAVTLYMQVWVLTPSHDPGRCKVSSAPEGGSLQNAKFGAPAEAGTLEIKASVHDGPSACQMQAWELANAMSGVYNVPGILTMHWR